ncbi:ubiquitin-binding protein cue5 [Exserohilum turcicum]
MLTEAGMSDPNFKADEAPPPQPPRPQPRSQLEQDEIYARQLAQHYQSQGGQNGQRSREQARRQRPGEPEREHSFFDDDLPEIRKNIEQGFKETQQTVTKWISNFTKKLDGEVDEYDKYGNPQYTGRTGPPPRQNFGPSQSDQMQGIRRSAEQRRSADHSRYDADNRVIGDDFAKLELRDNDAPQRSSSRPTANPDLFKPTPVSPPQSGPVDEVDALYRNPSPNNQSGQAKPGGKKWQPLTSVAPNPEPHEHDPFSLGDSDDEDKDHKKQDTNPADSERLKNAAQNSSEGPPAGKLQPSERSGSVSQKDATMEALIKEAK